MMALRKRTGMQIGTRTRRFTPALAAGFAAMLLALSASAGDPQSNFGVPAVPSRVNADAADSVQKTPFRRLTHGDQVIARAVMDAQTIFKPGAVPWPLDRIAEARMAAPDWEHVLSEMRAAGLMREQNLDQVIQAYRNGTATALSSDVVITNGLGDQVGIAMHAPREEETQEMAPASGPPPANPPLTGPIVTRQRLYGTSLSGPRGVAP